MANKDTRSVPTNMVPDLVPSNNLFPGTDSTAGGSLDRRIERGRRTGGRRRGPRDREGEREAGGPAGQKRDGEMAGRVRSRISDGIPRRTGIPSEISLKEVSSLEPRERSEDRFEGARGRSERVGSGRRQNPARPKARTESGDTSRQVRELRREMKQLREDAMRGMGELV